MTSNAIDGGMLVPEPAMAQMYPSGVLFNLLDPLPEVVFAGDIAHHLSMLCRYAGGVRRFYSVAEHAVLVADLLRWMGETREIQRAGLLHDAAEAYTGDLTAPLKYALRAAQHGVSEADEGCEAWFTAPPKGLRGAYAALVDRIDDAIGDAFGIVPALFEHPSVKTADMWALKIEAAALTSGGGRNWRYPRELPNYGELPVDVWWAGGASQGYARVLWQNRAVALGLL